MARAVRRGRATPAHGQAIVARAAAPVESGAVRRGIRGRRRFVPIVCPDRADPRVDAAVARPAADGPGAAVTLEFEAGRAGRCAVFYWMLKRIILGPAAPRAVPALGRGVSSTSPTPAAAILASNHLSFSDSFFLPLVVPRRVTFLAKSDYFTGRGIKGRLTAGFFRGAGQVPVDRSGGRRRGRGAARPGCGCCARGELLGIYPEGTRSPDGRLYRGRTGVARLALEARVPVLPVAMIGTDKVQPIGRVIPKIARVGMVIGKPLDFSRYEGMEEDRFVLRSITDEIMYELMELSGQEYVDVYASTMKERLAAARRPRGQGGASTARIAAASDAAGRPHGDPPGGSGARREPGGRSGRRRRQRSGRRARHACGRRSRPRDTVTSPRPDPAGGGNAGRTARRAPTLSGVTTTVQPTVQTSAPDGAAAELAGLDAWRELPAAQQPDWPDPAALAAAVGRAGRGAAAGVRRRVRRAAGPAGRRGPRARRSCCRAATAPRRSPAATADHDPQQAQDDAADGGRADLRRERAGGQGRPDRRPVRQAALHADRDPRRRDAAGLPRRRGQRLRLRPRGRARPDPQRLLRAYHTSSADAEPGPRVHHRRLRRPAPGARLEPRLRRPAPPNGRATRRWPATSTGRWRSCGLRRPTPRRCARVDFYSSHEALLLDYERRADPDRLPHRPAVRRVRRTSCGSASAPASSTARTSTCSPGSATRSASSSARRPTPDDALRAGRPARPGRRAGPADVHHPDGRRHGPRRAAAAGREGHAPPGAPVAVGLRPDARQHLRGRHRATRPAASTTSSTRCAGFFEVHRALGTVPGRPARRAHRRRRHRVPRRRRARSTRPTWPAATRRLRPAAEPRAVAGAGVPRRRDAAPSALSPAARRRVVDLRSRHGDPAHRRRCARRWRRPRSATTSTARTRPSTRSRREVAGAARARGRRCSCPTGSMANLLGVRSLVGPGQELLCDSLGPRRPGRARRARRARRGHHPDLAGAARAARRRASPLAMAAPGRGPVPGVDRGDRGREHAQLRRRHGAAARRSCARLREAAAAAGGRRAPRRRPAVERARRHRRPAGRVRRAAPTRVSVCLSKGLGAPVGSVLVVHRRSAIAAARVWRKRLRRRDAPGRHPRRGRPVRARPPRASGSPTTTPGPGCSPRRRRRAPGRLSTPTRSRPTSSCSTCRGPRYRGRAGRAGRRGRRPGLRARAARPCGWSPTSTSTTTARSAPRRFSPDCSHPCTRGDHPSAHPWSGSPSMEGRSEQPGPGGRMGGVSDAARDPLSRAIPPGQRLTSASRGSSTTVRCRGSSRRPGT